ncbi:MAG: Gfo/Idh/MocA family oxidoreductase [Candidatus Paceibacterota bacterium]|jgi:UDP-N-acetyl-2-amino-2-deoxyglucuronate dehydrogenase
MKFSIIGTGFIMPRHAEAIDSIGGKIIDVVNEYQGQDAWREMIKSTEADYIVILTPNDLHIPMAIEAAKAGKIVLCEKPLGINTKQIEGVIDQQNIFTVLQLRYHPLVNKLKEELKTTNEIEMDISVHRDEKYYKGWKGQSERSGGVLLNLGVHYFDLLLYLFGEAKEVKILRLDEKTGEGTIKGENYFCKFRVSTDAKRDEQRRVFKVNGENTNFSSKDNLSYENLHRMVYCDLIKGIGITPAEAIKSIRLVERLKGGNEL